MFEVIDFSSPTYLIAQAFAFASMVVSIVSQQYKSRTVILVLFVLANLFNAVHFFLLGAFTGVILAIIGAVRFTVSIFSTKKLWLAFFLVLNTMALYFVFEGYVLSGVSYSAATFIIISTFLKSDHWMRVCIMLGALGWLTYGILIGSVIAIISNLFFLVSSVIGWYRHIHQARS